ncbi:hypothetical protein DFS34DRAFT_644124 [Phlyctochytrium arcticum]|nr:hypothetical protein DFS34DRAFT_644124 [Phlyctochytrium arcticum]
MSLAVGSSIGFGIYYWLFTFLNDETDIVLNGVWWIATQFALVAAHIVCHTCMSISIDSREMTPKTKLGGRADAVRKRLKTYFFVVRGLSLVGSGIASSLSCYYMSARNRAGATWAIWTAILIWGVDLGHLAAMTRWSGKELGKAIQEATDGITHSASAVAAVHDLRQISTRIQRNSTTIVILTFSLIAGIFVCIVFIHVTYDTQTSAGILLYLLPIFSVVVGSTIFCIVWTFGLRQLFRGYQAVYTPDASISIAKDYI